MIFAAALVAPVGFTSAAVAKVEEKSAAKAIDAILAKGWEANHVKPNAPASDEVFVRRIYLDVVGRIPTYRETEEFLADKAAEKRAKLIDQLLAGDGYVQNFFHYWSDILRLQTNGQQAGVVTGAAYANYLKESLRSNKPYDQMVRDLVSAQGFAWENGAIGYYMRDRGMPLDNMANTVRVFLGTRIECAQCHNHPFDKWTQKEFFEMAAFTFPVETNDYSGGPLGEVRDMMQAEEQEVLGPLRQKSRKDEGARKELTEMQQKFRQHSREIGETLTDLRNPLRYTAVGLREGKQVTLPHDYAYSDAKPKSKVGAATMMGHEVAAEPGEAGLKAYAEWMTAKDNPRFTTVVANRLWKKVFGVGQIEPVDELMDNTQAMNPELMKHLEGLMVSLNYDMKSYLRILFNTDAYQREVSREEVIAGVPYHFPGPVLRRMTAEQMWDSFVTLINPTPDMPNEAQQELADKRIDGARFVYDSLEAYGPEAILEGAEKSVVVYRKQADSLKGLQRDLALARVAKDKDKVAQISKELQALNRQVREAVKQNVMAPAAAKFVSMSKGNNPSGEMAEASMEGSAMSMMMSGNAGSEIPGFDRVQSNDRGKLTEEQERQLQDEAAYFGISGEKEVRQYAKARIQNVRTWLRAAEIESPAPRGHYLREFGQSDREVIENANTEASVSQTLALMNSQLLPQVMNKYSALMLSLNKQQYHDDKVTTAYMTLLSRQPTEQEREIWRKAADRGLTEMEDLLYALINTQQFIFIQ
ncbi:DUF1549 domain-containing protein [Phragmitibacter flavus]|nr:DUF1549 domain-containing protein [Phragmitibacter flavus]